jgi:glycosyltransferase involved in cell wall biosynthesis
MKADFGVSVVIAVYNNADILPETIRRLTDFFTHEFLRFELIFVDDGSTDDSWRLLEAAAATDARIRVLRHEKNLDQQHAVANGALAAREDIIINVDADLPCALTDLKKVALMAANGTELVFGRRIGGPAQSWWRRCGTRFGGWLFRLLYSYPMHDFGCSTGAVRRTLIERMRDKPVRIWLLKVELLRCAKSYVETDIRPSEIQTRRRSAYSMAKLLKRFFAIFRYKLSKPQI